MKRNLILKYDPNYEHKIKLKKFKSVFICQKEVRYNLTIFRKGERVWVEDTNLDEGRESYPVYFPENGHYPVFGESAEPLIPHLKKIKMPKYPMEYYQAQSELKKLKAEIKKLKTAK